MRPQRKPYPSRKSDSMDHWLDTQGLYRKHTAKDGSCLFRAVAEQLFYSQVFHGEVREQVVRYMEVHRSHFKEIINESFDEYIKQMRNPLQCGGTAEIEAIGNLYRREIVVYHKIGCPPLMSGLNFPKEINLCFSNSNHYDSVYTKQHIENAGFCQSMVYGALYSDVFKLTEVTFAVNEMLHSKSYAQMQVKNESAEDAVELGHSTNMRLFIEQGITPFPFKVAKALDIDIYRNIEFDCWSDVRKEIRLGLLGSTKDFHVGVKCLVTLEAVSTPYSAYVQNMAPNKGPVEVYIEALGEKRTVMYSQLEVAPARDPKSIPLLFKPRGTAVWRRPSLTDAGDALKKGRLNRNRKQVLTSESSSSDQHTNVCSQQQQNANANAGMKVDPHPTGQPLAMYIANAGDIAQTPPMNQTDALAFTPPQYVTFVPFSGHSSPASSSGYFTGSPATNCEINPPARRSLFKDLGDHGVNYLAVKSCRLDFSDLPLADMPTLRFFYNLGIEAYNETKDATDLNENIEPKAIGVSVTANANVNGTCPTGVEENTGVCSTDCTNHTPAVTEADSVQYQGPVHVGSCFALATMVPQSPTFPYPVMQPAMYSHMMPFYPIDGTYYQPPSYDYAVNSVVSHPTDSSESPGLENQTSLQFNADLSQQSVDNGGIYPCGIHFNGSPTSFVFHHQSGSSGMFTPPPLNGVPYSPPPNGMFTIPPPPINAVFSPPSPGSPQNTLPPWLRNRQGK